MSEPAVNRAFLALGSNIHPEVNLPAAAKLLADHGLVSAVSAVWESAAVGDPHQANFLNAAVLLETTLSADRLKQGPLAEIERALGRVRDPHNKNAARTIDVDIALFNNGVFLLGERPIPDPEILLRPFLAVPLSELAPDYVHPVDGRTLREIAQRLRERSPALIARPDVVLAVVPAPSERSSSTLGLLDS